MMKNRIVLVPFSYDDLSGGKIRPALCLTARIGLYKHIVLAFITSQLPDDPLATDCIIDSSHAGFSKTGLRVSSTIRLHRLTTATSDLIHRDLGVLPSDIQQEVEQRLRILFGLA